MTANKTEGIDPLITQMTQIQDKDNTDYVSISARSIDSTLTAHARADKISRKGAKAQRMDSSPSLKLCLIFTPWGLCVRHAFFSICGDWLRRSKPAEFQTSLRGFLMFVGSHDVLRPHARSWQRRFKSARSA
jgi:hypothetical protein